MVRIDIERSALLVRLLLSVRPHWHANGLGWTLLLDSEPTEWFRTLSDVLQAMRALER